MFRGANLFCKARDDLVDSWETFFDHFKHDPPLDEAFLLVQVFKRRPTADPRQERRQSVLRRAKVKMRNPWHGANFVKIEFPVKLGGAQKRQAFLREMKRLAEEVGETEAD